MAMANKVLFNQLQDERQQVQTYAILGATGNTGTSVIRLLLKTPNIKINAFCRNQNKLFSLIPEAAESKKIEVFTGSIQDTDTLISCMRGCHTVFLLASTNTNLPGCRISQDLAITTVAALKTLRAESPRDFQAPKLQLLSSAIVDDYLSRHAGVFRKIMLRAASNVYEDLRRAEAYLRTQDNWLQTIYIKPGGLSVDIQRGHELSLDHDETFVSYMDLAAGMLEAANEPGSRFDGKNVSVINANEKAKFAQGTPACIFFGLVRHYLPFLHNYLPAGGPA